MRIAIPTINEKLSPHFGHCESFAFIDIEKKDVQSIQYHTPPPHQPGLLPIWLAENSVELVIAGGIGQKAQNLLSQKGIKVIPGAPEESTNVLVHAYLNSTLETSSNTCDH